MDETLFLCTGAKSGSLEDNHSGCGCEAAILYTFTLELAPFPLDTGGTGFATDQALPNAFAQQMRGG